MSMLFANGPRYGDTQGQPGSSPQASLTQGFTNATTQPHADSRRLTQTHEKSVEIDSPVCTRLMASATKGATVN